MHLVDSLLATIVREDGESLVLHVGERPVVVSSRGPSEIASSPMTLESMDGLLSDLLRTEARQALVEFGAVEADVAPSSLVPDERFTVVAARGGDDIWIEIRRRRPTASAAPQRPSEAPMPAGRIPDEPTPPNEPAVVLPLSRNPARGDVPARQTTRLTGLDRLLQTGGRAGRRGALSVLAGAAVDSCGRRDPRARRRAGAGAAGRRRPDARGAAGAARRGFADGQRVDLRRQGRGPRALPVVPRPPGARRHLPADSGSRRLGRSARSVARDSGAVRRA